jgi:Raf kinase inhibitor-like YbhB/YbcL family protein
VKVNLGSLVVTSPAFSHGERIPDKFTGNGSGVTPELRWSGASAETESFALIVSDPDAPLIRGFVHWVAYNIPATVDGIPEGGASNYTLGANGLGQLKWEPPGAIPEHGTHFYYFHLYALNRDLKLNPGLSSDQLLELIDFYVICQARLVGTFSRD